MTQGCRFRAILAPRDRPGAPWKRQDGHELLQNRIFNDFGVILGPRYLSFLSSRSLQFHFCWALVDSKRHSLQKTRTISNKNQITSKRKSQQSLTTQHACVFGALGPSDSKRVQNYCSFRAITSSRNLVAIPW